eukprot:730272-Ditylum_brightwellii.AAC.1
MRDHYLLGFSSNQGMIKTNGYFPQPNYKKIRRQFPGSRIPIKVEKKTRFRSKEQKIVSAFSKKMNNVKPPMRSGQAQKMTKC